MSRRGVKSDEHTHASTHAVSHTQTHTVGYSLLLWCVKVGKEEGRAGAGGRKRMKEEEEEDKEEGRATFSCGS